MWLGHVLTRMDLKKRTHTLSIILTQIIDILTYPYMDNGYPYISLHGCTKVERQGVGFVKRGWRRTTMSEMKEMGLKNWAQVTKGFSRETFDIKSLLEIVFPSLGSRPLLLQYKQF